jgi:hypothetical protein
LPERNPISAITGAEDGVDRAVIKGDKPRRNKDLPAILACPNDAPCLLRPYTGRKHRVDVQERALLDPVEQRGPRRQRDQVPPRHGGDLLGVAEAELPQEAPQRGGRVHLVEHDWAATGPQQFAVINAVRAGRPSTR